jgi:hypothetical protein
MIYLSMNVRNWHFSDIPPTLMNAGLEPCHSSRSRHRPSAVDRPYAIGKPVWQRVILNVQSF